MTSIVPEPRVPSPTVDRDRLADLLKSMRLDEERGAVWELQQCIERCSPLFVGINDRELDAEFEVITARAAEAVAFEETHGFRSLFNHEHPFNKQLHNDELIDLKSFPLPSKKSEAFWRDYFTRAGLRSGLDSVSSCE